MNYDYKNKKTARQNAERFRIYKMFCAIVQ